MANFETNLLDIGGGVSICFCTRAEHPTENLQLPGREQFVHVIFAPQAWSGYEAAYFPGIVIIQMFPGLVSW